MNLATFPWWQKRNLRILLVVAVWVLLAVLFIQLDTRAESPTGYIPSLNAKVTSLRFFESGYNATPREQREYKNRFEKAKTRYVTWELNLEHPAPGRRIDFSIDSVWYRANDSVLAQLTLQTPVEADWTWSYHNYGYGWDYAGNWEVGSYRVDLYVEGTKVASGSFEVYEATPADTYFSRGLDYLNKGMWDEAIAEYDKGVELNPRDAIAYYNRGLAYYNKNQYDQAISDYTKAIEINPKFANAYSNRGVIYNDKGQYDQAISDYNRAIEISPGYADAYNNRGEAYRRKGQYDQAISNYTKAIELNPKYADAYNNRGIAYKNKGQYDQAISDYTKTIEIDPNHPYAYKNREIAYKDKAAFTQPWQTSWDEFAKEVQRLYNSEAKESEFIKRFNGKQVFWEGQVVRVVYGDTDEDPKSVTIEMPKHKIKLPDGRVAQMDQVILPVKSGFTFGPDKKNRFRGTLSKEGGMWGALSKASGGGAAAAVSWFQMTDEAEGVDEILIDVSFDEGSIE